MAVTESLIKLVIIVNYGLAIIFYAAYCIRPMLVSGLRSSSIVTNQTLRPEDYNVFYQGVDGTPGVDFPVLSYIPRTTFTCDGIESGYYADLDTDCQVFHICEEGRKISFLCPNGTIFEQADLICEWWYKVNCTNAPNLYQESAELLREGLARRKASRRISLNGQETNHGAVMRMEESASVSAQQNGKTYSVSSVRGGRVNSGGVDISRLSSGSSRSSNNLIPSAIDKEAQNVPQKRYNDASTGNFINNNEEKQIYTRSTTPSSSLGGHVSNLGAVSSRKQSISNRGSVKFGSNYGSQTTEATGSSLKDTYDYPKHQLGTDNGGYSPKPTSGYLQVKIDSSQVDLGRIKPKSTVGFSRNDILNKRLESSESDELQVPQETAAFTSNTYNSIQSNTRKFITSSPHPNHRPTYSDLKQPDFSSTKFVNSINSVTPQYITTQSINSGKPFIGSTVGANIFNRNTGRQQQSQATAVPFTTTGKSIAFTVPPVASSTFRPFNVDHTEKPVPFTVQSVSSSTYQSFNTDNTESSVPSTIQPVISSTYHSVNGYSTEKPGPITLQPIISTSYQDLNNNNEGFSSTPLPEASSTVSPPNEGITTKTVDHAIVYGSFSKQPSTAAPSSGVEVKLGKNVDKVSIQLTKSLGGDPPKYSSTASPSLLASDGFVRITGGLSKPVGGSTSQIHFGIGSAKGSTVSSLSHTGLTSSVLGASTPIVFGNGDRAAVSTVVPDSVTYSTGTTFRPDISRGNTQDKLNPSVLIPEAATNFQSTTIRPGLYDGDVATGLNIVVEDSKNGYNGESTSPGYTGTGTHTVAPVAEGSTVVPTLQESTSILGSLYDSTTANPAIIDYSGSTETPSAQVFTGTSSTADEGSNLITAGTGDIGGTVTNGIGSTATVGTESVDIGTNSQSSYGLPTSSIRPDVFVNGNSRNTVSPPIKGNYDFSTASPIPPVRTGSHSQVTELLPIPDIVSEPVNRNNQSNTHSNSFRPNFYPPSTKNGNVNKLIIASSAIPSQGSVHQSNSFSGGFTAKPLPSEANGASSPTLNTKFSIVPQINELKSQNDIGSTLSPIGTSSIPEGSSGYNSFGSSTTFKPFSSSLGSSGFYVTRNSVYGSTTPPPFGLSTATTSSSQKSTLLIDVSPNSGEKVEDDLTNSTPASNAINGDLSLSKSETRWPRPFQRAQNSIDSEDSKLDSATPTYVSYKISSARPFELPKDKATPAPTIPTPFTTARSVQENVDSMINALQEIVDNQDYSAETPRPGLVIPPSAGPQTLHTLAQYFANALDGIVAEKEKETGEELDKESKEKLTSLLTQMTMYRYNQLFKESPLNDEDEDGTETTTAAADDELIGDTSNNLIETPELRDLARNFSLALSDYLKNPDGFRKELESLRPTEPPSLVDDKTEAAVAEEELLNFSDADSKSSFPPLFSTPQLPTPTWGYIIAPNLSNDLDVKNSLNPDLHTADTQSFVPGFNNLAVNTGKGFGKTDVDNKKDLPGDHWTTSPGVTKLWQSALSINPADLNENLDTTRAYSQTTEPYIASTVLPPLEVPQSEIQYELRSLPKVSLNSTQVHGILIDFVNTTKTDDSNRLQRLLRKLNTTEDEFLHRMKEIESNPLTKRLILLLISECGANVTKELGSDPVQDVSKVIDSYSSHAALTSDTESRTVNSDIPELVDPNLKGDDQDTRALQLLNSLYSIASKFGK